VPPRSPPERTRTDRTALRDAFAAAGAPLTVRELSQLAGLAERAVHQHLEHLIKSVKAEGGKIVVHPAECMGCGFVFEDRTRVSRPGRCPECRGSRIAPASYEYVAPEP
jgi:predicted Zn-ribbon and HTH transcriptional regulator